MSDTAKPVILSVREIADYIKEFLAIAAPQIACVVLDNAEDTDPLDENGEVVAVHLSVEDILTTWIQLPDCAFSYMFVGYMLAKGITTTQYNNADVAKAVCVALTGGEKNVMLDFIGYSDAETKFN